MTTNEMKNLLNQAGEIRRQIKSAIVECLTMLSATDKSHAIVFDWEEDGAPSYASTQFGDDLADAYVTAIWLDKGLIKVNLHAYYIGEDRENIDLNDETCADWEGILDTLIYQYD